jgi:uncharacterized membrane protein
MAKDVTDTLKDALGNAARDAVKNVGSMSGGKSKKGPGPLSGARGIAAGAGLAALVPLARKGVGAVRQNGSALKGGPAGMASKAASKATDRIGENLKSVAGEKIDKAGGPGGLVKEAASGLLPGGGDDDGGGKSGMPGVGKGRRMPVQQAIDVAVPLETAYNQWTQYETWPDFMHRVTRVSQEEETKVNFATKIWGKTKEFEAEIITQRPDDRVKWRVTQGITHTGVVSFHELAPNLTRIELGLDVDPGSLIEKAARGMRHVKRAARADLHRFKAFIEMQETETGAWRGRIEDGEVVEEHDESYDQDRDYSEVEDLYDLSADQADQDEDEGEEQNEERESNGQPAQERRQRFQRQAEATRRGGSKGGDDEESRPARRRRPAAAASKPSQSRTRGGSSSGKGSRRSKEPAKEAKPKARRS